MGERDLIIFDTETTGLDPLSGDRVIELAGVRVRGDTRVGVFQELVNPQRPVPYGAFRVNGISDEMLSGKPRMAEVLPRFAEFIRGGCLCSYNAPFDMGFLAAEYRLAGMEFPEEVEVIDVLSMARQLLSLERYALWFVAQSLGIGKGQAHRALSDVELTLDVYRNLSARLREKAVVSLDDLVCLFGRGCGAFDRKRKAKLGQIRRAIELGSRIRIRYFSRSDSAVTEREVLPREITVDGERTYFTGFCSLKAAERTFRLEGILSLEEPGMASQREGTA